MYCISEVNTVLFTTLHLGLFDTFHINILQTKAYDHIIKYDAMPFNK